MMLKTLLLKKLKNIKSAYIKINRIIIDDVLLENKVIFIIASVILTSLAGIKLYDAHDIMPILNKMDLNEIYRSTLKNGENVIYDGVWKGLQYHGSGTLYFGKYNLTGNFVDGKLYGRFIVCVDNIRIMSGIMLDGDIIEE